MTLTRRDRAAGRGRVRCVESFVDIFQRGNGTFEGVVVIGSGAQADADPRALSCGAGQLVFTQTQRPPGFCKEGARKPASDSYLAEVKMRADGRGTRLTDEHNLTQAAPRCNAATSASYFAMAWDTTCSSERIVCHDRPSVENIELTPMSSLDS